MTTKARFIDFSSIALAILAIGVPALAFFAL